MESNRHLVILHTVAATLCRSVDVDDILETTLDVLTQVTGHEISSLHLFSPDRRELRLCGDRGFSNPMRDVNDRLPAGEGLIGRVATSGQSVVLDDVTTSPYLLPAARRVIELEGIRAFVSVPIWGHRRILGTISLGRRVPEPFTTEDVQLLEATADQIAIALEHGRLNAELRQQVHQLTRAQDELLEAQRLAADANRAKDEFLATLSHELRTPLQSMLACVELLRREQFDQSKFAQTLDLLDRSVRTQTLLIGDLLDMSRIVAGKLRLERREVDLGSTIRAVVEGHAHAALLRGVTLGITLHSGAGPVLGDPVRLQQVVTNLISNALKFTPSGGRIDVRLEPQEGIARIVVADTGEGIDAELLPHVFEPFRQADINSTRGQSGLGLGLAIVRHLVALHGGTIRAESEGKGRGARFTLDLPVVSAPVTTISTPTAREPAGKRDMLGPSPLRGVRVLIVDDDPDTLEAIRLVLHTHGADVLMADSVQQAVEVLNRRAIDVLLSDLALPVSDGYELIRHVRAMERERGAEPLPAISFTAHAGDEERQRALAAGFQMHAIKPAGPDELVELVGRAVGRHADT